MVVVLIGGLDLFQEPMTINGESRAVGDLSKGFGGFDVQIDDLLSRGVYEGNFHFISF
jgi:hypothetical protein